MILPLYIFLGGGLGALARWAMTQIITSQTFPWAILCCNLVGSFTIGFCYGFIPKPTLWQIGFTTGLLGGFTTFSTFSLDTVKLIEQGQYLLAALNGVGSLLLGVFVAWGGYYLGHTLKGT